MSELEEMGTILMHIALQYTHPDFESMYSDWHTVHDIGEKLVKMSDQPPLNENQQIVIDLEMSDCYVEVAGWNYPEELDTENLRYLFSDVLENARDLEQEEE